MTLEQDNLVRSHLSLPLLQVPHQRFCAALAQALRLPLKEVSQQLLPYQGKLVDAYQAAPDCFAIRLSVYYPSGERNVFEPSTTTTWDRELFLVHVASKYEIYQKKK